MNRLPALSLLLALSPVAAYAAEALSGPVPAVVMEVLDGDTLAVRAQVWLDLAVETKVRIEGIDTPESRSRCADEKQMARAAKQNLERLVAGSGQAVVLRRVVHDKYGGRVRAQVALADGTDLAEAQIRAGHARAYQGGRRAEWCPVPQVGERPTP